MHIKKIRDQLAARKDAAKTRWRQMEDRMALADGKTESDVYRQSAATIKA